MGKYSHSEQILVSAFLRTNVFSLGVICFMLIPQYGWAQRIAQNVKVLNILSNKNILVLDKGSSAGLKKGQGVCIKAVRLFTCGDVVVVTPKGSAVKFSVPSMSAIKKAGMRKGLNVALSVNKSPSKYKIKKPTWEAKLNYNLVLYTPVSWNKLTYAPEVAEGGGFSTLWTADERQVSTPFGFGFELISPWFPKLIVGGRLRLFSGVKTFTTVNDLFVEVTESAYGFGLYTDWSIYRSPSNHFRAGLDWDRSLISITGEKPSADGNTTNIFAAAGPAPVDVIGIRAAWSYDMEFSDSLGFSPISITYIKSLVTLNQLDYFILDSENGDFLKGISALDDLKQSLNADGNKHSIELGLSIWKKF